VSSSGASRSVIAIVGGVLLVLIAWAVLLTRDSDGSSVDLPIPGSSRGLGDPRSSHPVEVRTDSVAETLAQETRTRGLIFVDSDSREPLAGVRLFSRRAHASAIRLKPGAGIARSDGAGRIDQSIVDALPANTLLAYAPGYVLARVPSPPPGETETEVPMRRSSTTLISCRTADGRPVAGCSVVVARTQCHRPPMIACPWIGQPGAKEPLWGARTADSGVAILEGIPPGSYRLHVFSDQWCAFETRYLGGADIQFPIKRLEVTVVPVLAAVFNLPQGTQEDVSVLWYQWRRQMEFARIPLLVRDYAEIALRTR